MAHTRLRKFNTKDTYPEQNLDNDLCQAVVTHGGRTVWLRGQCPQNLDDAKSIDSHDPVEQTHKVMQNIKQLIEEAGGGMEHLVKVVVYLTDIRHREAVYRMAEETKAAFGPIDILINNAGFVSGKPLLEIPDEQVEMTFKVKRIVQLKLLGKFTQNSPVISLLSGHDLPFHVTYTAAEKFEYAVLFPVLGSAHKRKLTGTGQKHKGPDCTRQELLALLVCRC